MLQTKNIHFQYQGLPPFVLPDLSLSAGNELLILGKSGSGKTTILNVLATLNLPHPTSQLGRISLSIGVAVLQPGPEGDPQRLIQQADQALYQAKYKGRNRAEYGQPDPS